MKRWHKLVIGGMLFLASQVATAANEVRVFGQTSCSQWLELTSNSKKKWLLGFLSGMNHGYAVNHKGQDPLEKVDSEKEIYAWMDAYCKANSGHDVSDGGVSLFRELKNR